MVGWDGMGRGGKGLNWDGMGWDGKELDGTGWNWMGRDGLRWDGQRRDEWDGMETNLSSMVMWLVSSLRLLIAMATGSLWV